MSDKGASPRTNVVDLVPRLQSQRADVTACPGCGGEWFRLHPPEGDEAPAVCLDADGRITGRVGLLKCNDCGRVPS